MGPTAPQAKSSQALDAVQQSTTISAPSVDSNSFQAGCFRGKRRGNPWSQARYYAYLMKFNPGSVRKFGNILCKGYFTDPEVKRTVRRILRCRLFYIITFRCGLGRYLFKACLGVLKHSWFPGPGTNPGGFDPEVTLFPYAWNPHCGFYGPLMLGWYSFHNGTTYYKYDHYNVTPNGDRTEVSTYSYDGDIYQNQNNINQFGWYFLYTDKTGNQGSIKLKVDYLDSTLGIHNMTEIVEMDANHISFREVWASTRDKSGCCRITSSDLDMNLNFEPSGKGGGHLKIGDDLYEFTVRKGGRHGFWTKNGGRKHYF